MAGAAARRDEIGPTGILQRIVNQLQAELDGVRALSGITAIAATNRIDLVDRAVLTPDRFGIHIHVPLPNEDERCRIAAMQLRGVPVDPETSVAERAALIGSGSDGYSGAEIAAVCEEAKIVAIRSAGYSHVVPVTAEHCLAALTIMARGRSGHRPLVEA